MKLVKILNCKNSLLLGLLFVVSFFPILMIMTNDAQAEVLTLKNGGDNSSVFEKANSNKTSTTTITTTTSNISIEQNLDNKTIPQQEEILQLKQIDDVEVGTNDSSTPSENNFTQTKELARTENDGSSSSSQGKVTIEAETNSEFKPPTASYIENEGYGLNPVEYQNNYEEEDDSSNEHDDDYEESSRDRNFNEHDDDYEESSRDRNFNEHDDDYEESSRDRNFNEHDDDYEESSRDRNFNEHDDSNELLESDSNYYDYLVTLENMKEEEEQNKYKETKVTEEIPKDNSELDTEIRDEEEKFYEERLELDREAREEGEEEEEEEKFDKERIEGDKEAREEEKFYEERLELDREAREEGEEEEEEEKFDKERIEGDKEAREEEKEGHGSDYDDLLLMLKMIKEKKEAEQQNKERETRVTEEIPKDNRRDLDAEAKEKIKQLYDKRLEASMMANKKQTLNGNNNFLANALSTDKIEGKQRYGAPIDNENKKLLSQFTKADPSSIIPDLQVQSKKSNETNKGSKLVANAGLDQILKDETRIVLDASSSFSSNGNISNFLWKQIGGTEEKIKPSNSMIYSFPIPEDIEDNTLEFELTVMDKKGQKASDTIKILLADEQNQVDNDNSDVQEKEESANELTQIQAVEEENEEDNQDNDNNDDEVDEENDEEIDEEIDEEEDDTDEEEDENEEE